MHIENMSTKYKSFNVQETVFCTQYMCVFRSMRGIRSYIREQHLTD
jgi:hypothetical protein